MKTLDLEAIGLVEMGTAEASAVNGGFGWKKFLKKVGRGIAKLVGAYVRERYGHYTGGTGGTDDGSGGD